MKTHIFLLSIFLLVIVSCNETVVDPKVPIEEDTTHKYPDCPFPGFGNNPWDNVINKFGDELISCSYDGKYVVTNSFPKRGFEGITNRWILDVESGETMLIGGVGGNNGDVRNASFQFDSTEYPEIFDLQVWDYFQFCPYDSKKIMFVFGSLIDTTGERKHFKFKFGIATYHIITKKLELSYTNIHEETGSTFTYIRWLPESTLGKDVVFISNKGVQYKYFVQENRYEKVNIGLFQELSKDLSLRYIGGAINDKPLLLSDSLQFIHFGTVRISPDKKYLLVSTHSTNETVKHVKNDSARHYELWVMEIDKLLNNIGPFTEITKINTRFQHCKYIYMSNTAVFTPKNTILISMIQSGGSISDVYEIDLKGNILRQVTRNSY